MKKILKILGIILLILIIGLFLLGSCVDVEDEVLEEEDFYEQFYEEIVEDIESEDNEDSLQSDITETFSEEAYSEGDTWVIYWYLCGSDLESENGLATTDLEEMIEVTLPDNVKVVIETGGASWWYNDMIDPNYIERYVYEGDEITRLEQLPSANMGDPETLRSFLSFCNDNYPADHKMVLFWNHGGGSVTGAAFDEVYGYDSLTLDEMYSAFSDVYELSQVNPPFDVVGFDTCLMATIDTAFTFADVAIYMVASEEVEPGNGWYYKGWLQALADNPGMDGAALGKAICDSFVEGCEMEWTEEDITLSVTDLSKIGSLLTAYDNIGKEALTLACEDSSFFSEFARNAKAAENYGGNSSSEGYTNMVDLGDLVRNTQDLLPRYSENLLEALEDCIVYKVNGPYRENSSGLSCYYSYNGDMNDFVDYTNIGASEPFKYLYGYEITGEISDEGLAYISDLGYSRMPEIQTFETMDLEDFPVELTDDGYVVLDLGYDIADMLQAVNFEIFYMSDDLDYSIFLGIDNDIYADWENGVFTDNFRGVWGAIDGYFVYMELSDEGDDYNIYTVPVLLKGEAYNLRVIYDFNIEAYEILGARKEVSEYGMADKDLRKLEVGDEITVLLDYLDFTTDSDIEAIEGGTFVVTEDTEFYEEYLGDGVYYMWYEMIDMNNESAYSDTFSFTIEGDDIYTEVYE